MAAWLLGFAYKKRVEVDSRKVRCRGLTREREGCPELLKNDDISTVRERLYDAVRGVEAVSGVYERLVENGILKRQDVAEILLEETRLGGSTTGRRAQTVCGWLIELPEIQTRGRGAGQQCIYTD
jgi:hypothetical protein